jgi:ribose-phosphate pyrophosphokinase
MNQRIAVFVGPATLGLGAQACDLLHVPPARYECRRFPDGEFQIELRESVRGCDVYLLQSTSPPVEQNLLQLLLLADACRRAGAGRLTAVIPYFGYARQDRRSSRRSLGARVAADLVGTAHFDRVMLVDAHNAAIEGFFEAPIDHLSAVPLLAANAKRALRDDSVVVAPDLGAAKLAREYARLLNVPMAIVHKTRLDGEQVQATSVIGDVSHRVPLIVDDMLSTGATVEAAIGALLAAGAVGPISVAITHALLVGRARALLYQLPIERLIATDTVALEAPVAIPHVDITTVAPLIAAAIRRDHLDESLADLRASA